MSQKQRHSKDGESLAAHDGDAVPGGENLRGRILIIDDEPLIGRILVRLLKEHKTVVATSGIEGRDILATDQGFDVILCDLMMPGFSGVDLFSWLQEGSREEASRIVFVTGGAFTPEMQEFLSAVNPPVIDKPIDEARLRSTIATLLQDARRHRSRP